LVAPRIRRGGQYEREHAGRDRGSDEHIASASAKACTVVL
jgi:hypothetical protein